MQSKLINLRMKKVLKEPSTQNWNRAFRQSPLRPPGMLLHHTKLLQGSLLSNMLIHKTQAWYSNRFAVFWSILLSKTSSWCSNLIADCITQATKVSGNCLKSKSCVWFCCSISSYYIKWWDHYLHLMIILSVPSINLWQYTIVQLPLHANYTWQQK